VIDALATAAPPVLSFAVEGIEPLPAAAPTLALRLRIAAQDGRAVRAIGLTVRVRIAAQRRRYLPPERERLRELFGPVEDWPRSLGGLPWTQAALNVGPFEGETRVEVPLSCTYDFEVAHAKYLAALEDGEVPLELLFSGTLYYDDADGRLQTAMVPWDREATAQLPVATWRAALDAAFPDGAWLRVHRDVLARLHAYRSRAGFTTWDDTLAALLGDEEAAE
jgi:uncharacterized protein DUF6084